MQEQVAATASIWAVLLPAIFGSGLTLLGVALEGSAEAWTPFYAAFSSTAIA